MCGECHADQDEERCGRDPSTENATQPRTEVKTPHRPLPSFFICKPIATALAFRPSRADRSVCSEGCNEIMAVVNVLSTQ
jgi:hypothetical protein